MLLAMGIWYYYAGDVWEMSTSGIATGALAGRKGLGGGNERDLIASLRAESSLDDISAYLKPSLFPSVLLDASPPLALITSPDVFPSMATNLVSQHQPHRSSHTHSSFFLSSRPWIYFIKVVVLPIFSTTFSLYLLLLFLLKDADLLDAQRNRLEIGEEWDDGSETEAGDATSGHDTVTATTPPTSTLMSLRGLHHADVCLLATSASAGINVSVGFDGIALVWKTAMPETGERLFVPPLNSGRSRGSIRFAAIDETGRFCSLGFETGAVFVWSITRDTFGLSVSPVAFTTTVSSADTGHSSLIGFLEFLPSAVASSPVLVLAREDGRLFEFECSSRIVQPIVITPSLEDTLHHAFCIWTTSRRESGWKREPIEIALASPGKVHILRRESSGDWIRPSTIYLPSTSDSATSISIRCIDADRSQKQILVVSLASHVILLYDTFSSELLLTLPSHAQTITCVRLIDPIIQQCSLCDGRAAGFILLASSPLRLLVYRILLRPTSIPTCSCPGARTSLTISSTLR